MKLFIFNLIVVLACSLTATSAFGVPSVGDSSSGNPSTQLGIGEINQADYQACANEGDSERGKIGDKKGYLDVMIKSFARSICRPDNDRAKAAMVKGNPMNDALHDGKLSVGDLNRGLSEDVNDGEDRILIEDYLLLFGLGLRESSGKFDEGRDKSADNTSGKTAEAGCFQSSANVKDCVGESAKLGLENLEESYANATPKDCMADVAQLKPVQVADARQSGESFQSAIKACPALAVEHAAITIRHCKKHYGPLVRHEAKKMEKCKPLLESLYKRLKFDKATCDNLYRYGKFGNGGGGQGAGATASALSAR